VVTDNRCGPGYRPAIRYDSLDSGSCVKEWEVYDMGWPNAMLIAVFVMVLLILLRVFTII
jgi:hypothetical protein